ncbi:MAG: hypothetical protein JKY49_11430 [Cohaesibacteraceae bacterium]|nr:hypothetical protein [Cohaesibacteraceae bacterium]
MEKEQYVAAEVLIESSDLLFGKSPEIKRPVDFYILWGCIKYHLGKDEECIKFYQKALNVLIHNGKLSSYDKQYLNSYILDDLNHLGNQILNKFNMNVDISNNQYFVEQTSKIWKDRFPVKLHPGIPPGN